MDYVVGLYLSPRCQLKPSRSILHPFPKSLSPLCSSFPSTRQHCFSPGLTCHVNFLSFKTIFLMFDLIVIELFYFHNNQYTTWEPGLYCIKNQQTQPKVKLVDSYINNCDWTAELSPFQNFQTKVSLTMNSSFSFQHPPIAAWIQLFTGVFKLMVVKHGHACEILTLLAGSWIDSRHSFWSN